MSELFLQTVSLSYRVSFLILAILLLRLVLKKAPKWISVALWGIAAVRLLLPFSPESIFSLVPAGDLVTPEIMLDPTPTIQSGIPAVNDVINPILQNSFTPAPGASMNPLQFWVPAAAILWMIGFAVMALYTLISYLKLKKLVSGSTEIRKNTFRSSRIPSPFILGFFRPRIYLPEGISEADEVFVVAHEEAHLRRRDHWWKPIGFLLLSIHWFNPLMWLGYIFLCRDIELACDEKVIDALGAEIKADYSQALLNCSISRKQIAACPLAFGEGGVKQRIKAVLYYKKPTFWILVTAIVISIIAAVCFLTDPLQSHPSKPELVFDYSTHRNNPISTQVPGRTSITVEIHYDKLLVSQGNNSQLKELAQSFFSIQQAYFCDLTGDGVAELCAQLSVGSGIIDYRICVYDFAAKKSYELQDRSNRDFYLYEENDTLMVKVVPKGALQETGFYQLALEKTALGQRELTCREYTPTSGIGTGIYSFTLSEAGTITMDYFGLSGGYSVEMLPADAMEYCGDGMIPYDGALGSCRMMITFGDTDPTDALRKRFPAGEICTLLQDSLDFGTVKAKLVYPSDHGCVLYIGADLPFSVAPEQKTNMNHLWGRVYIRLEAAYIPPRPDTSLDFWIGENVDQVDFYAFYEKRSLLGGRQYYGKGYIPKQDKDGQQVDPEHCVIYTVNSYPDFSSKTQHITRIQITDPNVVVYGLTCHSKAEEIRQTMTGLGYEVRVSNNTITARKGNCAFTFANNAINIRISTTNHSDGVN